MRRMRDPFPPTPEGFHHRVEATLCSLEASATNKGRVMGKTAILLAAALAALVALTAVAAVLGHSKLKDALDANRAGEVSLLVQEVHATGGDAKANGFDFSVDELIWEDDSLFMTYSMGVPETGKYMVALYTPTLNGEALTYNAYGWTLGKFFDQPEHRVLLLGGDHGRSCTELLTFKVDPALRDRRDNALRLRAVLLKTDLDIAGEADFGGLLNPPDFASMALDASQLFEHGESALTRGLRAALDGDGALSVEALIGAGLAERVDEREIALTVDASQLEQVVFNDVRTRDFDRDGVHIHVDRFRLTHTGVSIQFTLTVPSGDEKRLDDYLEGSGHLAFGTPDGKPLGLSLGTTGGGGMQRTADGGRSFTLSLETVAFIPLKGLEQIILAPVEYPEDEDGRQRPPVYDLARALVLTPVYSEAAETASPAPAAPEDEDEPLC